MADTVFALSSGPGPCGVAVFRLSGPSVRPIIEKLTGRPVPAPRQAVLRDIFDPSCSLKIDRGLVLFFPGPASFTGEDVAEFHLHGAVATIRQFSAALAAQDGVSAAKAGDFTQRAYRNGKLDLLDVEALADLLAAETVEQARLAHIAAKALRDRAAIWRAEMLDALALTEAAIDFSDEADIADDIDSKAKQHIRNLLGELSAAVDSYKRGERIRRGYRVALCGLPNAGKSSLLNALAKREVAIVSPIAGTTRDVIEVHLDLAGYPVIVSDTAGLRDSDDPLEVIGIARAREVAFAADLRIWLSPVGEPVNCPFSDALIVWSKADQRQGGGAATLPDRFVSVTTGVGLDALMDELSQHAQDACGTTDTLLIAHGRQESELRKAAAHLHRSLAFGVEEPELRSEELRCALQQIDRLTGRLDPDEVLGAIFSRFCIGK